MNRILQLYDPEFVIKTLTKRVLPHYPDFVAVKKVVIKSHKKHIWETTYHVVVEFKTTFITKEGKKKKLPIFCSAHSCEPRKNVHTALRFLWDNGFGRGYLSVPHPLFYSEYFKATFYRGVQGHNLYHYIRERDFDQIEAMLPKAAAWFAKLHRMPTDKARNFNKKNSRISTVLPGVKHILGKIENRYPQHLEFFQNAYNIFISKENRFLEKGKKYVVHGDAHPENVIKMSPRKIAVIDFTDICLSDFARDLGTFLQQLDYMSIRKIGEADFLYRSKKLFLDNYLQNAKMKMSDDLEERIDNYYNWTAIRTATYFLLQHNPEPSRAEPLINEIRLKMGI